MTAETMAKVVNLDELMPYVEPPKPREEVFAEEMIEHAEMYSDEAQYHRSRKDYKAAGLSESIRSTMFRVAKSVDPELEATLELKDLAYKMDALRSAITESRRAVMRAERKAEEAAKAARQQPENTPGPEPKEEVKAEVPVQKAIEAPKVEQPKAERPKTWDDLDDITVSTTTDSYIADRKPVTIRLRKDNLTQVYDFTRPDAVQLCAKLFQHLKETRPKDA